MGCQIPLINRFQPLDLVVVVPASELPRSLGYKGNRLSQKISLSPAPSEADDMPINENESLNEIWRIMTENRHMEENDFAIKTTVLTLVYRDQPPTALENFFWVVCCSEAERLVDIPDTISMEPVDDEIWAWLYFRLSSSTISSHRFDPQHEPDRFFIFREGRHGPIWFREVPAIDGYRDVLDAWRNYCLSLDLPFGLDPNSSNSKSGFEIVQKQILKDAHETMFDAREDAIFKIPPFKVDASPSFTTWWVA
ncbi:hypothetical protein COLO4_37934 [Corchorus olitorius]|uniref:Uncharacterized protein n=1 Tax=Corchorus olitorius TaxID=93759 RepID=A0A1R3FXY0_9ROSI|nr:hypothetical protein COLO4_37934 [Corchorus olitorius]